ncbi:MAG: glycoside hydrolase family 26 protein [Cytophagaceae bacterium]|nr:glycoside hydrolase family 26 protein [Cytophagaceae bacterium]MDW8455608.1 glycosyl hydrolase [Cytophagaceae bacterium]
MRTFFIGLCFSTVGVVLLSCVKKYDFFHSKSKWMQAFFAELKSGKYPKIAAISWWHEDYDDTYLTIHSSVRSKKTYQQLVKDDIFVSECIFSEGKLIPLKGHIYHSAFPDFGGTEDVVTATSITDFERLAQKKIAWAYFSNNWMDSLAFPLESVKLIAAQGKTPFIRIMYRSEFEEYKKDPKCNLRDIIAHKHDAALKAWAREAKSCGTDLLVEFGTEVNGSWFPWNGLYSGAGKLNGYGDSGYPDGPEIFRDAYRHIIDICNNEGCHNITWFFHADVYDDPEEWWNHPKYYYPGDSYIDWIGMSTYGPMKRGEKYYPPKQILQDAYNKMTEVSLTKPFAILEFGITEL